MIFHSRTARGQMIELANKLEDLQKAKNNTNGASIINDIILYLDNGNFQLAKTITTAATELLKDQQPHIYSLLKKTLLKKNPPFQL